MIVAYVSDSRLRAALRRAGHAEEDVVFDPELAIEAIERGSPRLLVLDRDGAGPGFPVGDLPTLIVDQAMLEEWDRRRKAHELPPRRTPFLADRLRTLIGGMEIPTGWVDRTLADLSRAAGAPLPPQLRGFARRILEFPSHYVDLHSMAEACGSSRGALKARFRRRGLESPYTYMRWFRMMAVAQTVSDRSVTIARASHRLGFTSDGNLCRAMVSLTGLTPTEARTVHGWNRLLISFAWSYLTAEAIEGWTELGTLFERAAA